jgi:hypothetical protein
MELSCADETTRDAPDYGYFFRLRGAVRFRAPPVESVPGYAQPLAVAQRYGVTVWSDQHGKSVVVSVRARRSGGGAT